MKQHIENALKGAALGAINAVLVAVGISTMVSGRMSMVILTIVVLCLWTAIPLGAVIGLIAGKLRTNRIIVLELIALAAIPMVGAFMLDSEGAFGRNGPEFLSMVVTAASPTAIMVLILERWTAPAGAVAHVLGRLPIEATTSSARPLPSGPRTAGARSRT